MGSARFQNIPDGFVAKRQAGTRAVVRADFLPVFEQEEVIGAAVRMPRRVRAVTPTGGRGAVGLLDAGDLGDVVIRLFRRGGWMRYLNERLYLLGNRAFHELLVTERLRARAVPVAEPVAAIQTRRGLGYQAALVTRRVAGRPAPELLAADQETRRGALERIGVAIGLLHAAGGWHADLNAHNLLLPPDELGTPAVILDFDRGRLFPEKTPRRPARRNLRRLQRSFTRLGLRDALDDWEHLMRGYEAGLESSPR